jgi:hypothetical protein
MTADDTVARLEALEKRIRDFDAVQDIQSLKYRYLRACDHRDLATYYDCFAAADLEVDFDRVGTFRSRDELYEYYSAKVKQSAKHLQEVHHGGHPTIQLYGDGTAAGRWELWYVAIDRAGKNLIQMGGSYEDEYVREGGEWKIHKSSFKTYTFLNVPIPEELVDPGSR